MIGMITTIIIFMIKILIIMIMIATMTMMTIIPMMTSDVMELPSGAETVYRSLRLRFYPLCLSCHLSRNLSSFISFPSTRTVLGVQGSTPCPGILHQHDDGDDDVDDDDDVNGKEDDNDGDDDDDTVDVEFQPKTHHIVNLVSSCCPQTGFLHPVFVFLLMMMMFINGKEDDSDDDDDTVDSNQKHIPVVAPDRLPRSRVCVSFDDDDIYKWQRG